MDETARINESNIENIRNMIRMKKSAVPYMSSGNSVKNIVTDMDHHPYTRWYRGVYYFPRPIVMEREAGWRPVENSCYSLVTTRPINKEPNHCFSTPCSTIYPCFCSNSQKYADRRELADRINKSCTVGFR